MVERENDLLAAAANAAPDRTMLGLATNAEAEARDATNIVITFIWEL